MKNYKGIGGPSNYAGTIDEEIQSKLSGSSKYVEFRKMADNDSIVGGILFAIQKVIDTIEWKIDDDTRDIVKDSFESVGWDAMISDILSFLIYGYGAFEVTVKEVSPGRFIWSGMENRPQTTVSSWIMDKRNIAVGFNQRDSKGNTAKVALNRCLHFRTTTFKNNPEGKSILRNAYRDWYYRTNIERIESIGIERDLTGLPVLTPPDEIDLADETGAMSDAGTWAWNVVKNIKRNEQEGLVLPFGWEFNLIGSPGQRQFDLNDVIARYDGRIATSVLSQFMILGMNSTGNGALSKEQVDLFYKAVEGFALIIARVVNTQFMGTKVLQTLNGLKKQPKIVPIGSNRPDLQEVAAFLARLFKFNAITPDEKLEIELRRLAGLPEMEESTRRIALVESPNKEESNEEPKKDDSKKQSNSGLGTNEDS